MYEGCTDHGELFDADQVAGHLSDFETEAESEDSMYIGSDSDDSNSSVDDGSIDDSDVTASNSDSSSSLKSDLGASGDDGHESSSTSVRGRGKGTGRARSRGRPGVKRGRGGRGGHSARRRASGRQGKAGTGSSSGDLYVWTTIGEGTCHRKNNHRIHGYKQACSSRSLACCMWDIQMAPPSAARSSPSSTAYVQCLRPPLYPTSRLQSMSLSSTSKVESSFAST